MIHLRPSFLVLWVSTAILVHARIHAQPSSTRDNDRSRRRRRRLSDNLDALPDQVPVMIKYKNHLGLARIRDGGLDWYDALGLAQEHVVNGVVAKTRIAALEQDDNIDYVEVDDLWFREGLGVPHGIRAAQGATYHRIPPPPILESSEGPCSDPNVLRVAVIDDGLDVRHPDLAPLCGNDGCLGASWASNPDTTWDAPDDAHGSHISGIIAATRTDRGGIQGMISDGNLCLLTARVFDDEGGVFASTVLKAVDWAVTNNAKVITLSMGGGDYSQTANDVFLRAFENGSLVFASAGNLAQNKANYPASYDHVVSVSAVNETLGRTDFSNYHEAVDIAAPGSEIVSTVPSFLGDEVGVIATSGGYGAIGTFMRESQKMGASGELVHCGLGESLCPGEGGHICLIQRGMLSFKDKATNCQMSGGVGVLVYNNVPGKLKGTLFASNSVTIPVVEISQEEGDDLRGRVGEQVTIEYSTSYAFISGTSMAVPHAAGAAALAWRSCQDCVNADVYECLIGSARDIGDDGKDDYFGHGLVQAEATFACLASTKECCSDMELLPVVEENTTDVLSTIIVEEEGGIFGSTGPEAEVPYPGEVSAVSFSDLFEDWSGSP